jgi:DNA-binding FadR family transcriptional regulator
MTSHPGAQGTHARLVQALGGRIASGDLPSGTVLTLADLEREFDASRTAVREAVRVLESLELVRSRRRVGITVQPRETWRVLDGQLIRWTLAGPGRQRQLVELMELRAALEPAAARLAAERATDEQRTALVGVAAELDRLGRAGRGDSPEYLATDIEFHTLLLAASGNLLYAELAAPVREILQGRTELGLTPAVPVRGTLDAHVAAAAAVAAGDGEAAEHHVRTHLAIVSHEVADGTDADGTDN